MWQILSVWEEREMTPDMSPQAITARLKLLAQITRACLSLKNAEFETKKGKETVSFDTDSAASNQPSRASSR